MKLEKIESFEALKQRFEALRHLLGSRVEGGAPNNQFEREVLVCGGTGCVSSDSSKIVENLRSEIDACGLSTKIQVLKTGCFGFCEKGPIVLIQPDNGFYVQVTPDRKSVV